MEALSHNQNDTSKELRLTAKCWIVGGTHVGNFCTLSLGGNWIQKNDEIQINIEPNNTIVCSNKENTYHRGPPPLPRLNPVVKYGQGLANYNFHLETSDPSAIEFPQRNASTV